MKNVLRKSKIYVLILVLALVACFFCVSCSDTEEESMEGSGSSYQTEQQAERTNQDQTEADDDQEEENQEAEDSENEDSQDVTRAVDPGDTVDPLTPFEGEPYVEVNGNVPQFTEEDLAYAVESYEEYGQLDHLGRCTTAVASLSADTQPVAGEERESIQSVHPSGWRKGQSWERMHLIGWRLSAENANELNLITGTHYCNVSGMLPFEDEVNSYIKRTGNHVLYRVTPIYNGDEPVARGVLMEAESVEDRGAGISYNVYVFNVEPGAEVNYVEGRIRHKSNADSGSTSQSQSQSSSQSQDQNQAQNGNEGTSEGTYVLNTSRMKFHYPDCHSVRQMAEKNKMTINATREEIINMGYSPCGNCHP